MRPKAFPGSYQGRVQWSRAVLGGQEAEPAVSVRVRPASGSNSNTDSLSTSNCQHCAGPAVSTVMKPSPHVPAGCQLGGIVAPYKGGKLKLGGEAPAEGLTANENLPPSWALSATLLPAAKCSCSKSVRERFTSCNIRI